VVTPNAANYITLGQYFGPDGDADGDGYTNQNEYEYLTALGGKDLYLMGALDPAVAPVAQCSNSEGGYFSEGDSLCLSVPGNVNLSGGFEWLKNGYAVSNNAFISGSHWRELHFNHLHVSDAGNYECVYNNGSRVFGPVKVGVLAKKMPAAGLGGLVTTGLAMAGFGMRRLRRKRKA
jgi:hypothetical protein